MIIRTDPVITRLDASTRYGSIVGVGCTERIVARHLTNGTPMIQHLAVVAEVVLVVVEEREVAGRCIRTDIAAVKQVLVRLAVLQEKASAEEVVDGVAVQDLALGQLRRLYAERPRDVRYGGSDESYHQSI